MVAKWLKKKPEKVKLPSNWRKMDWKVQPRPPKRKLTDPPKTKTVYA